MAPKFQIVKPEEFHIIHIAEKMRLDDQREVWAMAHMTPEEALRASIKSKGEKHTVLADGEPIAMFGVGLPSMMSGRGVPWLLAREGFEKYFKSIGRYSRRYIDYALDVYDSLENYIDIRNTTSIRWLRWLGFNFDQPEVFGPDKRLFMRFWKRRDN